MDAWEDALRGTVGTIVPDKSHWYLIDFMWKNDKPTYKTNAQLAGELTVLDDQGIRIQLEGLEPTDGRRTLGVRAAPNGNLQAELDYLCGAEKEWADTIRTGGLDRHSAWMYLKQNILKKLEYPLLATAFTQKQCAQILRPVLMVVLPVLGINRHFPRIIVHSAPEFLGLNIPDLYTTQGIEHIKTLVTHGHQKTDVVGSVLRASLEQHKLELGRGGSLF
jgi:hypothetical protein